MIQEANVKLLDATSYFPPHRTSRSEPLRRDDDPKSTSPNKEVKLQLKPLPSNLRYAFLDSNFKFSFIMNSFLPNDNVDALCDVYLVIEVLLVIL